TNCTASSRLACAFSLPGAPPPPADAYDPPRARAGLPVRRCPQRRTVVEYQHDDRGAQVGARGESTYEGEIVCELPGYRVVRQLGRGSMGVVYLAEDLQLCRNVALKVLAPSAVDGELFRQRFDRESRSAATLDHPNIIPIYAAGQAAGALYIAMRYV